MRVLITLRDQELAMQLSRFLLKRKIAHEVEVSNTLDWGSDDYKDPQYTFWVIEEDDFVAAEEALEFFLQNPAPLQRIKLPPFQEKPTPYKPVNSSWLTTAILFFCTLLFLLANLLSYTGGRIEGENTPTLLSSPLSKWLLFDYPEKWSHLQKLAQKYGIVALDNPKTLPLQGRIELQRFLAMEQWNGIYPQFIEKARGKQAPIETKAPLFHDILQGQIWRLFTPAFLHFDRRHIFFNMIWAFFLGRQIEWNIGSVRYLVLILLSAAFSNTAQYLMSGPNFLGYSGVVCAFVGFIWVRQHVAPWEPYFLQRSTAYSIFFFIGAVALWQTATFWIDVVFGKDLSTPIANTAHIAGGLIGALLAFTPFFKTTAK